MMGIGVIDSIASVDEINKATNRPKVVEKTKPEDVTQDIYTKLSDKQKEGLRNYYATKVDLPFMGEEEFFEYKGWT